MKQKTKYLSMLLLTLLASTLSPLDVEAKTCVSLFQVENRLDLNADHLRDFTNVDLSEIKFSADPSVEVLGVLRDSTGLDLLVLKKIKNSWYSRYTPAPSNNQGDPRWFPMVMGTKVGSFFGFRVFNESTMTAPRAET